MKKAAAILSTLVMLLGLTACGEDAGADSKADMSKYPSDLNEWSGQNFIDYFKEAGVFYDGNGGETWIQDHANYWPATPVNECAGWWTDDDSAMVMICVLNADNADTSQEQLDEWKTAIKDTKKLPGDYSTLTVDHLVGNVTFTYSTILDEKAYNDMDAAYRSLIGALGETPEF